MIIQRSELFAIEIPAGANGEIKIQDQPLLREQFMVGLETYGSNTIAVSPVTPTPVATYAQLQQCSLKLYYIDPNKTGPGAIGYFINYLPLVELKPINDGDPFTWERMKFDNLKIQWDKCTIVLSSAAASAFSINFNVYYVSGRVEPAMIGEATGTTSVADADLFKQIWAKLLRLEEFISKLFPQQKK